MNRTAFVNLIGLIALPFTTRQRRNQDTTFPGNAWLQASIDKAAVAPGAPLPLKLQLFIMTDEPIPVYVTSPTTSFRVVFDVFPTADPPKHKTVGFVLSTRTLHQTAEAVLDHSFILNDEFELSSPGIYVLHGEIYADDRNICSSQVAFRLLAEVRPRD